MTTHSMIQDANGNIQANSILDGYTTTATAAATTTLTVASTYQQFFTGTTTQTVKLPVTSTLVLGQSFYIVNNSTGTVTVQSSGSNTIQAQIGSTTAIYTCILTSGTTAASWSVTYINNNSGGSGTVNSGTAGQLAYYATSTTAVSGGTLQNVLGIASNTASSAGYVGELISSQITSGSPVTLSNNAYNNLTSISLTTGDWDVWGNIFMSGASTISGLYCGINTTSATFPDTSLMAEIIPASILGASGISAPQQTLRLSSTTTVYLVTYCQVASGGTTACGGIYARRRT